VGKCTYREQPTPLNVLFKKLLMGHYIVPHCAAITVLQRAATICLARAEEM
jgi:hypothetical protein